MEHPLTSASQFHFSWTPRTDRGTSKVLRNVPGPPRPSGGLVKIGRTRHPCVVGITQPSQPPRRRSSVRRAAVLLAAILSVGSQIAAPSATMARTLAPPTVAATAAPAAAANRHLSSEVVGYLPYWEMNTGTFADLDLTKLSSIVLFSIGWNASGHLITNANGYAAITRSDTIAFVAAAKAAGVRVLVSFTS